MKLQIPLILWLLILIAHPAGAVDIHMSTMVPWSYPTTKSERYDGINIRILRELSRRSGVTFNYLIVPTARHLIQFRACKLGLSFARDENFTDDIAPVLAEVKRYPSVVQLPKGSAVRTYEELVAAARALGVGILRGLTYHPLSKDMRLKKIGLNDMPGGLKMLQTGRLAGVVGTQPLIQANIKFLGLEGEMGPQLVVGENVFVIRAKPGTLSAGEIRLLQATLGKMREDHTLDSIFQTYMQEPTPPAPPQ